MQQSTEKLVADVMKLPSVTSTSLSATSVSTDALQAFYKDDIINLASTDMDMLAGLAIPEVLNLLFPPVFKAIWQLITEAAYLPDDTQLAIGLPRGFGKTTVVKLYILFLVLFTNKRFILITALNQDKAKAILRDVDLLLTSPNIRALFGNIKADSSSDNK